MRGDFSAWNKDRSQNFRGTLHQQGRVLLDRDWNAQTEIVGEWQETAGRDAFGAGVAAIPSELPASFKVTKAEKITTAPARVEVTVNKGRVWADGLLVESAADVVRSATYINPPPGAVSDLPNNLRDAVILETWLEELSPFQAPDLLIEPALGGVDTTERVQTAYRFRLFRMAVGETCDSIIPKLKDDFSLKGKLTAKLADMTETDGDCPVVESGGYTGFEHRLYRIEIAEQTQKPGSWFKWSQFNGGLVGRGVFDAAAKKVEMRANQNAIAHCGINTFYLEALEFDTALGCWQVIYGVNNVTLNADNTLTLPAAASNVFIGSVPPKTSGGKEKLHFFRLWNGIERVNDFTAAAGTDLPDKVGIKLKFDAEGAGKYTASDFWTFEARVGQGVDATTPPLVDNKPPHGIFYHRVPLAEIHWTDNVVDGDDIEDCRRPFQPLTKLKTCCTYRVGDGVSSHGDFTKIQDAIKALPKTGGEVCILPGTYTENIVLKAPHNRNIILKGCGKRTILRAANNDKVLPENDPVSAPEFNAVIYVKHGQDVTIESLAVEAHEDGVGIYLDGNEQKASDTTEEKEKHLKHIVLSNLFITAAKNRAIEAHTAQFLTLERSVIRIKDMQTQMTAVYLAGDDMLIERNEIRVLPDRAKDEDHALTNDPNLFVAAQRAAGGLQISGGSERVRIINNLITGGTGNGITLGNIDLLKDNRVIKNHKPFRPKGRVFDPCNPDGGIIDDGETDDNGLIPVAGPPLYDILIKFNRIINMGRNGIGLASAFSLNEKVELSDKADPTAAGMIFISKLVISENRIERCMNIPPADIKEKSLHLIGFGGISLAIVEELVINDNFIVDNCRDCRYPICGIFVLVAIGADISCNEITEHIVQDYGDLTATSVKPGARGGIWILIAIGQIDFLNNLLRRKSRAAELFNRFSDAYALKIHENVVSIPLGRSLTTMTLGDASILGNRFTSYGLPPVNLFAIITSIMSGNGVTLAMMTQLFGLLATNILIFDLGTILVFKEIANLVKTGGKMGTENQAGRFEPPTELANEDDKGFDDAAAQSNFDPFVKVLIKGGLINFSENQCKFNPLARDVGIAICSVFIAGLADLGFHGNQVSCDMPRTLMIDNALLYGGTNRVTGNWFRENIDHVAYSAATWGILNITSDNESVHCLKIGGEVFLDRYNLVLRAWAAEKISGSISKSLGQNEGNMGDEQDKFCDENRTMQLVRRMLAIIMRGQKQDEMKKWGVTKSPTG